MVFHRADTLALFHVPEFDGVVRGGCRHLVAAELELSVGQLTVVPHERAHAVSRADVPDFGSVVEGGGQDLVSLGVETDGDDLFLVAAQFVDEAVEGDAELAVRRVECLNGAFEVVDACGAVERTGCDKTAVRVEGDPTDLALVPDEFGHALARVDVPDVGRAVEAAGHYLVAERVVERQRLHHILMP